MGGGRTRSIESSREAFPNAIGCLRRRRAPLRGNAYHINKRSVCRIAAVSSDLCLGVKGGWVVGGFGGGVGALICDKTRTAVFRRKQ